MAFKRKEWKEGESGGTPITPEELNRIEQGIADAAKTGGVEVGTIVEWEDDVAIPEGYEEVTDPDEIVDITSTGIILESGYSFSSEGNALYKQGKRIFGSIVITKSTAFAENTDARIGKLWYSPKKVTILPMVSATSAYAVGSLAYLYIDTSGSLTVKVGNTTDKTIKGFIEYVTN